MKSFKKRRHSQPYLQAEALVDARNKVFNIVMAVLLVFTMLPITAFTYESQASAEPLNSSDAALLSEDSAGGSGSSADGSSGATGSESSGGGSTAPGNNGGETPSTVTDSTEGNDQNNDS